MSNINPLTQQPISDDELSSVSALAALQLKLESELAAAEAEVERVKDALREITEQKLPEAMMNIGMESFSLKDGTYVSVTKFYRASISEDRASEAYAWLRENNYADLIKREIKTKFGKGEDQRAMKLAMTLAKMKIPFEDKESVHPQTLKAFVREMVEGGKEFPMDLLGVYIGNKSKVTPATK